MYRISKDFSFCFGHRVHTQQLTAGYAGDLKCACRHLHGHEGLVRVTLSARHLNDQGMVTDFRHLEWLKRLIDTHIDHQFVFHKEDPLLPVLVPYVSEDQWVTQLLTNSEGFSLAIGASYNPDLLPLDGPFREYLEGLFLVDFVPTSENFSRWLHGLVQHYMNPLGVHVDSVTWYETPRSSSTFYA